MKNYKSKRGVYYNTKDSEDYYFVFSKYKIYFSSLSNLNRFKTKVSRFIFEENSKIKNRYKVNIDLTEYFIFTLYNSIEKRGYKIFNIEEGNYVINSNEFNINFISYLK